MERAAVSEAVALEEAEAPTDEEAVPAEVDTEEAPSAEVDTGDLPAGGLAAEIFGSDDVPAEELAVDKAGAGNEAEANVVVDEPADEEVGAEEAEPQEPIADV